ncbi:MAG: Diacylglycerol O-acyltransferase [Mycobacterium sp.]|nr:Diacylglycerol O-acyltransferase [Mycobacterium sp.]MDT5109211.1 diacylglycerol O-acyltransferase / wax synthase [Mycobacterium sp.]MDT5212754.1 diacylglycerol O-acyltransferase / wax synthase [Mycobacterium sp.]MDT5398935.1 diacylglycerol O-acyltransferase / wax synthase [Mycobacterium sp.]MDT7760202.1 diacylglycerol O-acyltransferase / wax synthase [Mycobacterium sp.]
MGNVTSMELISPTDSLFLVGESREHPMHVGGLSLYQPPEGAGPDFVRDIYEDISKRDDFQPTFRKHPARMLGGIPPVAWTYDDDVDIDYHLRRSALPRPGRVRDLLELTSRLHGTLLDRHRPLWEANLIEGLNDGRFAVYVKFQHSLIDGVSAQRLLMRAMTSDPDDLELRVPWTLGPRKRSKAPEPRSALRSLADTAGAIAGLAPSGLAVARAALFEQHLTLPFRAPKTMFNVNIGGARRVAAQSWPLARIRAIKDAAGVTVNDVVLAMCAGALRGYLAEHDALPDAPLIAMVPLSLRSKDDQDAGGNMVGTILCNLATDIDDAAKRLESISTSMSENKQVFAELPKTQALALSAFLMSGIAMGLLPGFVSNAPPPFNIVISNVPGVREPMYWGGARLDGNYPFSIPLDGQALNITITNNADNLDFGIVGGRREVPHMQRLLLHLEDSLADLERAVGV